MYLSKRHYFHIYKFHIRVRGAMDIAVIGSNMVDLITYIDRMPKEGKPLRRRHLRLVVAVKGLIKRLLPLN